MSRTTRQVPETCLVMSVVSLTMTLTHPSPYILGRDRPPPGHIPQPKPLHRRHSCGPDLIRKSDTVRDTHRPNSPSVLPQEHVPCTPTLSQDPPPPTYLPGPFPPSPKLLRAQLPSLTVVPLYRVTRGTPTRLRVRGGEGTLDRVHAGPTPPTLGRPQ